MTKAPLETRWSKHSKEQRSKDKNAVKRSTDSFRNKVKELVKKHFPHIDHYGATGKGAGIVGNIFVGGYVVPGWFRYGIDKNSYIKKVQNFESGIENLKIAVDELEGQLAEDVIGEMDGKLYFDYLNVHTRMKKSLEEYKVKADFMLPKANTDWDAIWITHKIITEWEKEYYSFFKPLPKEISSGGKISNCLRDFFELYEIKDADESELSNDISSREISIYRRYMSIRERLIKNHTGVIWTDRKKYGLGY